jgi:hypothetical protein
MRNALALLTLLACGTTLAGPDGTPKPALSNVTPHSTSTDTTIGSYSAEQWTNILGASARLRTLSQKAAKEYFFIAANVEPSVYRASLKTTIEQFDSTFTILTSGNESTPVFASETIATQYDKAQIYWSTLKEIYTKVAEGAEPDRANFPSVDTTSTQLFDTIDAAGDAYAKAANAQIGSSTFGQTITAVGTQRTLSQRLAKEFTLVYLGVFTSESQTAVVEGTTQFDKVLSGLFNGDSTLGLSAAREPSVIAQLNNIKNAWDNYRPLLAKGFNATPSQNDVQAVAQSNDTLFQSVNVAFQTFQAIGKTNQAATVTGEQVNE